MGKKYEAAAAEILAAIGGAENVNAARHCQTRLRFVLKDQGKVDREALEAIPAVLKVIPTEGMYQVVIGTDVATCYEEIVKLLPESIGQDRGSEGFTHKVKEGDTARAGQLLLTFDKKAIAAAGHPDVVVIMLTNAGEYKNVTCAPAGTVTAGTQIIHAEK